jgi:hypothetical protein
MVEIFNLHKQTKAKEKVNCANENKSNKRNHY